MGNNHPSNGTRPFRRTTGSLGLSRVELEERCKPSGLYETCAWEDRTIRRLIGDGKLAPRLHGTDNRETGTEQECPICFLHYNEINLLECCKASICTECYLQIQTPRERDSPCPFCNKPNMTVAVAKKMDVDDVAKREEEEQKVIEATIRARVNSESRSTMTAPNSLSLDNTLDSTASGGDISLGSGIGNRERSGSEFGRSLDRELARTRSRTMSSDIDSLSGSGGTAVMSPEERRMLEEEMRMQLSHPLMREMQRNAELESQRHLLEHAERRRDRLRSSRHQLGSLLERARERERGIRLFSGELPSDDFLGGRNDAESNGRPSINDLYLLEAALYLSSHEDSLRRRGGDGSGGSSRSNRINRDFDNPLIRALFTHQRSGGDGDDSHHRGGNNDEDDNDDDDENNDDSDDNDDDGENNDNNNRRDNLGVLNNHGYLLAGLSEASQIDMAIQMSLREAEIQQERQQEQEQEEQQQQQQADQEGQEGLTGVNSVALSSPPLEEGMSQTDESVIVFSNAISDESGVAEDNINTGSST
mmetsp:Transcript_14961/g.17405  ORF Transcript_14961/g.17405 Transcript_14961/m.17405 type:complete len:534 (+) Transcript_14961:364-1965(+)